MAEALALVMLLSLKDRKDGQEFSASLVSAGHTGMCVHVSGPRERLRL